MSPDTGEVSVRKRARIGYVKQISEYAKGDTVRSVLEGQTPIRHLRHALERRKHRHLGSPPNCGNEGCVLLNRRKGRSGRSTRQNEALVHHDHRRRW